ncbi:MULTISPECIES: type I-C CRISPR-associated protein Cas5c [Heyndrickxia]|jgi:CRISPR-associated protein Cas5d|uniref:pre-crRNA processing endonuclease n=3 Tax=Heyndrickxia coagulans TaxID=1398 RepID=A0AAW7C8K2_HEYCO|nr:type I-C CRISPR-associated protein Cas5c [Heyndrickxia coagulans]AVD55139.1 type I-C CRISPR-associated protein Cas5 [Heyndrickxia coagulans]MCI1575194.1 type I-C CRISPR-associated protein Cas5c [Heyndrickxia coagulans]MDL5039814.1 type I-C CRISPR-associated protein Cas5c [Heyndrickxia coagulans]MDT9754996.1 type I-C CRISPR-associated protein Cas5c [Heyndrickxia coagulans]MEC5270114.1 type I-C CRISPR-associated protein Cas5c [Heyndrickxia coagulans]
MGKIFRLKVWGEYALFTRVEAKVERVSYPVMTPSAARGILTGIFWKPEFKWRIKSIHVLKPIQYYSILRNEVASIVPSNIVTSKRDYFTDDDRQLRHSIMLRDVAYIITAEMHLMNPTMENKRKYASMFLRRVAKGQCFYRPYLGTRECSLHFSLPEDDDQAIPDTMDIGPMLFDLKYPADPGQKNARAIPYFFNAKLDRGILHVPEYLYKEVDG